MRLLSLLAIAGCHVGGNEPVVETLPPMEAARAAWDRQAWPALARCIGCHGVQPAIDFLAPGTVDGAYETVFARQPAIVDIESPSSSLLVTMGKHTGPAFEPAELAAMLEWLEAERVARLPDPGAPTYVGPFTPVPAQVVTLDLPGTSGAQIRLRTTSVVDAGTAFSNIELVAGTRALHLVHPVFVAHPAESPQLVDELDRFDEVDLDIAANTAIDLGSAIFLGFAPGTPLTVHFHTLEEP